ncbi:MAG: hypothetical protein PHE04_04615 [Bacteroidales bacterium]|nr:hypothetical protein [Bacteroidales bacterium]MDD4431165.1 hypothetical protein [Bacteroidales bacterium]
MKTKISWLIMLFMAWGLSFTQAAAPATPKAFIRQFEKFVEEVEKSHQEYKLEDWKLAEEKYKDFVKTYYPKFKDQFSREQLEKINYLQGKYIGFLTKSKFKQIRDQAKEWLKYASESSEGFLEALFGKENPGKEKTTEEDKEKNKKGEDI